VDVAETLAIARAKELFGADHANVQPHSGAQANTSVYLAALKPGDTILGMNLSHGGHLTHGHPLNFSGKYFAVAAYGVRKEDERIDYEELKRLAVESQPKVIVVGVDFSPHAEKAIGVAADWARAFGAQLHLVNGLELTMPFLAPYEVPKQVEFLDALPMTTTGKVQRKVLRERAGSSGAA